MELDNLIQLAMASSALVFVLMGATAFGVILARVFDLYPSAAKVASVVSRMTWALRMGDGNQSGRDSRATH